ncbi:MAG: ATP-binding protein [Actinobacteria bacterium]|nr:ATP-binding protein [Actinomycetota bacterium]
MYELLLEQNQWWSGNKKIERTGILREFYLNQLKKFNDSSLITVLTGIRRCGKSTLLYQNIQHLLSNDIPPQNIFYFNFFYLRKDLLSADILEKVYSSYSENVEINYEKKRYIFFDEIQEVKGFESWIIKFNELNKNKCKIILTGSSSGLTSSEISTYFTGRNIDVRIYPLDFKEFLLFNNQDLPVEVSYKNLFPLRDVLTNLLLRYFKTGGFPEIVLEPGNYREIISSYLQDIIYRDVIRPFGIEKTMELEGLSTYLLSIASNIFSSRRTAKSIGISFETVRKYISAFEKSLLFYRLSVFSLSKLIQISENISEKIYVADHGFINFAKFSFSESLGVIAENIIFNYLNYKFGKTLGYYRDTNSEIDFIYFDEQSTYLTQVTFTDDINKRATAAIIRNQHKFTNPKNIIITKNIYEEKNIDGIRFSFIPLWYYLLQ